MQAQGRWVRRRRASLRAGAIHRQQENDRNSINIEPIMETPPLADSCEQTPDHNVEQSRCMSNPSLQSPDGALLQPPSCFSPSPNHRQSRASPLLQALSQTCWCFFSGLSGLGGRSKQETPRPPPGKCLQRAPPARGAECRCELRALLACRGSAAAAAAPQALT